MRQKSVWIGIGVTVLVGLGLGLWLGVFQAPSAPKKVTLMFGFTPNVGFAPYYVAAARGFYSEEGLDVDFQYTAQGTGAAMQQVAAGQVEFSYGGDSAIIDAASQDMPVIAVQKIIQKNLFRICAKQDSGISNPAGLRGKSIAFAGPTSGDATVGRIILHESGIEFTEIEARYVGAQTISSLVQGQVDAAGFYLPQQVIAESLLRQKLIAIEGYKYTPLGTTYTFTSKRLAEKNPDIVEKFILATQKGLNYAIQHPEEAVNAFILYNPDAKDNRDLHLAIWKAMAKEGFDRAADGRISYGLPSEDNWDRKIAQMVAAGILERPVDLQGYITDRFARKALGR